jgi:PAS domain-containing protein
MSQGLILFDSSERIVIFNQRYVEMYGLSTDVVRPGCAFRDLLYFDHAAHVNNSRVFGQNCWPGEAG